jgi:hypothetical protein
MFFSLEQLILVGIDALWFVIMIEARFYDAIFLKQYWLCDLGEKER